ncbi:MAG: AAA family ATPase [Candidatus Tectomicrobia bacterium]|uniref:AAA family ATPase n=1 Tax=Tectimicrobiota bacterium TaxID=2528274 RepID=A0A932FWN9_UNCTE|nr:AAA family ATPase [Candidatus Tectomicrobia bacterium]
MSDSDSPGMALEGVVDRILFLNEGNGYTVARFQPKDRKETVTIAGNLPDIRPGETLRITGRWSTHRLYGEQFQVEGYLPLLPTTPLGVERYLGSGVIKGIGPIMARRLVQKFGADTLHVIEEESERLLGVEGIGEGRVQMIREAWQAQRGIREVMIFLQAQGIGTAYSTRIFKQYGQRAVALIQENPYQLASDVPGIGFKTADKIAQGMGIDPQSPVRAQAGLLYLLRELSSEGHVCYPVKELIEKGREALGLAPAGIASAISALHRTKKLVVEADPPGSPVRGAHSPQGACPGPDPGSEDPPGTPVSDSPGPTARVYLPELYRAEVEVAQRLAGLTVDPGAALSPSASSQGPATSSAGSATLPNPGASLAPPSGPPSRAVPQARPEGPTAHSPVPSSSKSETGEAFQGSLGVGFDRRVAGPSPPAAPRPRGAALEGLLAQLEGRVLRLRLVEGQRQAIREALSHKVLIITGGPGTGKTTTVNALLQAYEALKWKVLLCAPTGRAAKRLSEATRRPATTIHRLLEFSFQKGGFQRDAYRPLEAEAIIVDEASMIDLSLMQHLVRAIPPRATLILVGDINQLPSVGPGNVLRDLLHSGRVQVIELTEIFRQARQSLIVTNAHRIHEGVFPFLPAWGKEGERRDFYFIPEEDPERVLERVKALCAREIPQRFGFHPSQEIQVLTPMNKGTVGALNLNLELQQVLNPSGQELARAGRRWRLDDKVMQVRNNYSKEVFNGDIGRIVEIDPEEQRVTVKYDTGPVDYEGDELDELMPAYAISVHRSQGSEYPAVVIPLLPQHYLLLQRNLLYTALTRARRLAVLVGSKRAIAMAVKNDKIQQRYTSLQQRLEAVMGPSQPSW